MTREVVLIAEADYVWEPHVDKNNRRTRKRMTFKSVKEAVEWAKENVRTWGCRGEIDYVDVVIKHKRIKIESEVKTKVVVEE